MPWRDKPPPAFWLDSGPGLAGHPEAPPQTGDAQAGETTPPPAGEPRFAVITVADRIGFEYRRVVGLDDFVSQRDAAQLLGLPVMTVTRWTASGRLKSKTMSGFTVVRLGDLLDLIKSDNRPLRTGRFLATVHASDDGGPRIESEIIYSTTRPTRARRERKR